jgi:hypothetical protein
MAADASIVSTSRNIQTLTMPWELRMAVSRASLRHSEGETDAETLCQNSDVAIVLSANLKS